MLRVWLANQRGSQSQLQIAKACNITQQAYSKIENGRPPSVKTAKIIASVLNFDWTKFYEDVQQGA